MPLHVWHLMLCQGRAAQPCRDRPQKCCFQKETLLQDMTQTNHILVGLTWPQRDHLQRASPQTLSFLFCCGAITFLFLLSPALKTLAQLLRHVCTWGKQSHSSLSGDVLYAAGQLSPPAAPAARAANLEKMQNMHIANSHSSSQNCAPDTQAQPSKLLRLCTSERHVCPAPGCLAIDTRAKTKEKKTKASGCRL